MAQLEKTENIQTKNACQFSTSYTLYLDDEADHLANIIYFHGGGFITGKSNDLPQAYIDLLTQAGFRIFALDYPLAPEYRIDQIVEISADLVQQFINQSLATRYTNQKTFFILGRSAGAFLALKLGSMLRQDIKGIVSFYGYYDFQDAFFAYPSQYYLQSAKIEDRVYQMLLGQLSAASDNQQSRLLIYLYTRQRGTWLDFLSQHNHQIFAKINLNDQDLEAMPTCFLTCAMDDPDVPSRQSVRMSEIIPLNDFHPVESSIHDFDRVELKEKGLAIYQHLIDWLNKQL